MTARFYVRSDVAGVAHYTQNWHERWPRCIASCEMWRTGAEPLDTLLHLAYEETQDRIVTCIRCLGERLDDVNRKRRRAHVHAMHRGAKVTEVWTVLFVFGGC